MSIGLPKIEITFQKLASTAVQRSARGIVALIVKDDTNVAFEVVEYTAEKDIETSKFTAANAKYIKDAFKSNPSKVIVVRIGLDEENPTAAAIKALGWRKYNWIGYAEGLPEDQTALATYVKAQEKANAKNIKTVVFNAATPDCMSVVNLTNEDATFTNGQTVTGEKLVSRILGILAATPMTETATYKALPEVAYVTEPSNVGEAINAGKFVLINDEGIVRIGRAVTSLTTLEDGKTEDMKKIAIVESIHLMKEDIIQTFKTDYLGKYKNKYDNQILLISAINSYFQSLQREQILDPEFENTCSVDVETQRAAWIEAGKAEALEWEDAKVKTATFRSNVYLGGNVKILDGMEDFKFGITME